MAKYRRRVASLRDVEAVWLPEYECWEVDDPDFRPFRGGAGRGHVDPLEFERLYEEVEEEKCCECTSYNAECSCEECH